MNKFRKKQAREADVEVYKTFYEFFDSSMVPEPIAFFVAGAEWSDIHPSPEIKYLINAVQDGCSNKNKAVSVFSRKTMNELMRMLQKKASK